MGAQASQNQKKNNQSEKKSFSKDQAGGTATFQFQDNRPEATQLRKLQEASVNSQASNQIAQLKGLNTPSGNTAIIQLASDIKYDTTEFDLEDGTKEVVGKKMEATLEAGNQLKGSAPGDGVQEGLMGKLKTTGYKRMIRGHLLNGQLGGLGIALNLFPISAKANSQHKNHVENRVKKLIMSGKDVQYNVEVVNAANKVSDPNADFKCDVTDINKKGSDESFNEVVSSAPGKNIKSSPTEGKVLNSKKGISFPSSKLKSGWGEVGKGYRDDNNDHRNTIGHISSVSFEGTKTESGVTKELVEGRSFVSGATDRKQYAFELLDQFEDYFDDDGSQSCFGLNLDELEDHIDNQEGEDLEGTIDIFKNSLGV